MQIITARDACTVALKLLSVQAGASGNLSADKATDALFQLNLALDEWNTDGGMIYTMDIVNVPLANGTPSQFPGVTLFTIGPDFTNGQNPPSIVVPQRPQYLSFAAFEPTNNFPAVDIPMNIIDADQYTAIRTKGVQSGIPNYIYLDGGSPVANIYMWTQPDAGGNLVMTYWSQFNSTLTLDTTIQLPPGYAKAIILETAIAIAPMFGKAGSPQVAQLASSLNAIKRKLGVVNERVNPIQYSGRAQGVIAGGPGTYNIYTDEVM